MKKYNKKNKNEEEGNYRRNRCHLIRDCLSQGETGPNVWAGEQLAGGRALPPLVAHHLADERHEVGVGRLDGGRAGLDVVVAALEQHGPGVAFALGKPSIILGIGLVAHSRRALDNMYISQSKVEMFVFIIF